MNVIRSSLTPQPITGARSHNHECWEIILNLTGRNRSVIDGIAYEIGPDDVMVIPPEVMHSGETHVEGETASSDKYTLYTDIYVAAERLDFDGVVVAHDYEGSLNPLMHMILKTTTEKESNYSVIADGLLGVICEYIKKYRGVSYRYPFVADFKNLLFDNIPNASFSISDCVRESGFSLDYFRRCFAAETGATPLEYLNGLRIEQAKKLLAQAYMSVAEVASRCGFSDSYYFSKKFHREVGKTPRDYMKSFDTRNN